MIKHCDEKNIRYFYDRAKTSSATTFRDKKAYCLDCLHVWGPNTVKEAARHKNCKGVKKTNRFI
jgi:hypothetical protein